MHPVDQIPAGGIVSIRDSLLKMQSAGRKVLRLESGDPSFRIPAVVEEAITKALRDGHTHYTAGAGILPLRKAIMYKLNWDNCIKVKSPEHVLVTNGAMHALYVAFQALIEAPGDEILVPDPTWTETADNVRLAGGTVVPYPIFADDGSLSSPETLFSLITPRTRAIVINTPHNPTGMVIPKEWLHQLMGIAFAHKIKIVSDEAYEHIIYDHLEHVSVGSFDEFPDDIVISIFSMSKSFAMSGLRVGYLACNDDKLMERMSKLTRCTINGVNSAAQHGAVAALMTGYDSILPMVQQYTERCNTLLSGLIDNRYLTPRVPQGAFYVWCKINEEWPGYNGSKNGWAMSQYLVDTLGVGSAPGEVFGSKGVNHIRFAFSCSTDQVQEAAQLLSTLK